MRSDHLSSVDAIYTIPINVLRIVLGAVTNYMP